MGPSSTEPQKATERAPLSDPGAESSVHLAGNFSAAQFEIPESPSNGDAAQPNEIPIFFFLIPFPCPDAAPAPLGVLIDWFMDQTPQGPPNDFCGDSPRAQEVSPDKVPSVNECGFVTRRVRCYPEPLI